MSVLRICSHQVGGHMTNDSKPDTLIDGAGSFYKPYQAGDRNVREGAFYILVWGSEFRPRLGGAPQHPTNLGSNGDLKGQDDAEVKAADASAMKQTEPWGQGAAFAGKASGSARPEDIQGLRSFIPQSFGVACVHDRHYLVLEDVCHHYKQPCVLDLKVGFTTLYEWAPEAYQTKCRQKDAATTQHSLGFRMSGMQYYKRSEGRMHRVDRQFGRQLNDHTMQAALAEFAGELGPEQLYRTPSHGVVAHLAPIREWFKQQRSFQFYQASVLITWEGEAGSVQEADVQVHLIDFAHTFPSKGEQDTNFLRGLDSIISILGSVKGIGPVQADGVTNGVPASTVLADGVAA